MLVPMNPNNRKTVGRTCNPFDQTFTDVQVQPWGVTFKDPALDGVWAIFCRRKPKKAEYAPLFTPAGLPFPSPESLEEALAEEATRWSPTLRGALAQMFA